jgi:hypothetical protein
LLENSKNCRESLKLREIEFSCAKNMFGRRFTLPGPIDSADVHVNPLHLGRSMDDALRIVIAATAAKEHKLVA